jgi:N-sulfoglucosamine sulfohydrolase
MHGQDILARGFQPRDAVFAARDRCDETVFRFRSVRDADYRYIRNFTPERPYLQSNAYKERAYPVWTLIPQLDKEGKLPPWHKAFYMAPDMPPEELYDIKADPWAMTNLVRSPEPRHQAARQRLHDVLDRWIEESNDQGRVFETVIPEQKRPKNKKK